MHDQPFPFQTDPKDRKLSRRQLKQNYVPPRQAEDHWRLYRKGLYVVRPGRSLPAWLLPLLALLLITALVFWAVPAIITRIQAAWKAGQEAGPDQVSLLYDDSFWTVREAVADVFDRDDLKGGRLTQVLYNEPVRILSRECTYGFARVQLGDGSEGYMLLENLLDSRDSIEPDRFSYKVVISAGSKRVMSHASKGTLLIEVLMGTVLYADYRGDGVSRVCLPGGDIGWISDDGALILTPSGEVAPVADGARYFCTTALGFNQVTFLENGQSIRGICPAGIVRLSGQVNGIRLPRSIIGMSQLGTAVETARDSETGRISLEQLRAGDLVFLAESADQAADGQPSDVALYLGENQILYARTSQSSIRVTDLTQNEDLWQRIALVRRLFPGS